MRALIFAVAMTVAGAAFAESQPINQKSATHHTEAKTTETSSKGNPTFVNALPSGDAKERAEQEKADRDAKRKADDDLVKFTAQLAGYTFWLVI